MAYVLQVFVVVYLFFGGGPAPITDVQRFPEALAIFWQLHGPVSDFLPASFPFTAQGTRLDASLDDRLQAEPYLELEMQLPQSDAAIEVARLRTLNPISERPDSYGMRAREAEVLQSDRGIRFDFADPQTHPGTFASVWHDPDTGWFLYSLRRN